MEQNNNPVWERCKDCPSRSDVVGFWWCDEVQRRIEDVEDERCPELKDGDGQAES